VPAVARVKLVCHGRGRTEGKIYDTFVTGSAIKFSAAKTFNFLGEIKEGVIAEARSVK